MTTQSDKDIKLTAELAIEPDLEICDAHHHLWDRPNNRYMPDDLIKDINGHRVPKTVFVECWSGRRTKGPEEFKALGETEFVLASTKKYEGKTKIADGIVVFADLKLGEKVTPVLEGHVDVGGNRVRGVRYTTAWDPSPYIKPYMNSPKGLLLDSEFQKGFACLKKFDFSFDAATLYHQIPEVSSLAKSFPDTVIILDHLGGPILVGPYAGREKEVQQDWRKYIKELSLNPNVVVKLGGLGLRYCGFGWYERDIQPGSNELTEKMKPYFMWCIECFGVKRCMLESNFPEDKVSFSYSTMWNAFKIMTKNFTETERTALFYGTAVRAYRL